MIHVFQSYTVWNVKEWKNIKYDIKVACLFFFARVWSLAVRLMYRYPLTKSCQFTNRSMKKKNKTVSVRWAVTYFNLKHISHDSRASNSHFVIWCSRFYVWLCQMLGDKQFVRVVPNVDAFRIPLMIVWNSELENNKECAIFKNDG